MSVEETSSSEPHPRHVSSSELSVLQDCLHRWRTEVENDVKGEMVDDALKMFWYE